jgi:hypothetical protein
MAKINRQNNKLNNPPTTIKTKRSKRINYNYINTALSLINLIILIYVCFLK